MTKIVIRATNVAELENTVQTINTHLLRSIAKVNDCHRQSSFSPPKNSSKYWWVLSSLAFFQRTQERKTVPVQKKNMKNAKVSERPAHTELISTLSISKLAESKTMKKASITSRMYTESVRVSKTLLIAF